MPLPAEANAHTHMAERAMLDYVCEHATYKPGFLFHWHERTDCIDRVVLSLRTPFYSDVTQYGPEKEFTIEREMTWMECRSTQYVVTLLYNLVTYWEHHERDEWFAYEGKRYYSVHPELGPPPDRAPTCPTRAEAVSSRTGNTSAKRSA